MVVSASACGLCWLFVCFDELFIAMKSIVVVYLHTGGKDSDRLGEGSASLCYSRSGARGGGQAVGAVEQPGETDRGWR